MNSWGSHYSSLSARAKTCGPGSRCFGQQFNNANGYADAQSCANWCQSFRAPGFVGFDVKLDDLCTCRYSKGSLPATNPRGTTARWEDPQHAKGAGPVGSGSVGSNNAWAAYHCYKVLHYEEPPQEE